MYVSWVCRVVMLSLFETQYLNEPVRYRGIFDHHFVDPFELTHCYDESVMRNFLFPLMYYYSIHTLQTGITMLSLYNEIISFWAMLIENFISKYSANCHLSNPN